MSLSVSSPRQQDAPEPAESVPSALPLAANLTGEGVGTLDDVGLPVPTRRKRLQRITKSVAGFFGVQVVVQILTLLSGLLLVRSMGKTEYAFYTLANSMQGTINVLGDSGVSGALVALAGVVWQDKRRLGELVATSLEFRRKFGALVFVTVGPFLWWLLYSNGTSVFYGLVISVIVLASAGLSLTHGVLVVVPRLHSRISQLQNAELVLAGSRLILVGAACLLWLNAAVAMLILVITLGIQNVLYRRWAAADADLSARPNAPDRAEIWKLARLQIPGALFYCFQCQLLVFLIGFFGSTSEVANVGALGRLTVIFSVINSLMTNLVLPRFARCQTKSSVTNMYLQILAVHIAMALAIVAVAVIFPGALLWVLGSKYAHLKGELIYMMAAAAINIVNGVIYSMNVTKGWVKVAWLTIPIILIGEAALIPFVDLGSIRGVVLLTALPSILGSMPLIYEAYFSIKKFNGQPQIQP